MVNRLILEKAHVSKVVKKLQNMGLINITPLADDKRSALLSPTSKGRELVNECREVFRIWSEEWFQKLTQEELLEILAGVGKLQAVFLGKYSK